ncbi:MAG TPA: methylated-DNA--[protein]-cysteine S-methyltransferase [Rhodospirillales bacterium]|nr:methylated-DNA--[protein]-cysteine S-methyltransferase [Rhodospirillales bacterium]
MPHITVPSPFGPLTVFEDEGAVVALERGRATGAAAAETDLLRSARRQLDAYFDGALQRFTLPLRPAGTSFQRRVWLRLTAIPYGTRETYGALARELGTGPRALAGACAANPLTIVVPCHRVVAAGGAIGGYSSGDGIDTKLALLRLEGALDWRPSAALAKPMDGEADTR